MRVQSPDISWHGSKDRILSIDFHPFSLELASAGSDDKKFKDQQKQGTEGCIKIWQIVHQKDKFQIKICYGLMEATTNVNVVKYSPNGAYIASGADNCTVTIWQKRQNTLSMHKSNKVMRWSQKCNLAGHSEQVIDLQWTRNSKYVISAGMDRRVFIFDVKKRYHVKVLDQHEKLVQGVAVDAKFQYIITASNDRTVKVWKAVKTKRSQTGFYCKKSLKKFMIKKQDNQNQINDKNTGFKLFIDQSVPTFFRRPDISPDDQLFLLPAGIWQKTPDNPQYCALLYRKNFLDCPSFFIPTKGQPALVCKFCPRLFKKQKCDQGLFKQPYYMVFAVATTSNVLIYSTQSMKLLYGMGNYHYASLTDLVWKDAQILGISSSDGYCSFMIFEQGQLGIPFNAEGQLSELVRKPEEFKEQINHKVEYIPTEQEKIIYRETATGIKKHIVPTKIADL